MQAFAANAANVILLFFLSYDNMSQLSCPSLCPLMNFSIILSTLGCFILPDWHVDDIGKGLVLSNKY